MLDMALAEIFDESEVIMISKSEALRNDVSTTNKIIIYINLKNMGVSKNQTHPSILYALAKFFLGLLLPPFLPKV